MSGLHGAVSAIRQACVELALDCQVLENTCCAMIECVTTLRFRMAGFWWTLRGCGARSKSVTCQLSCQRTTTSTGGPGSDAGSGSTHSGSHTYLPARNAQAQTGTITRNQKICTCSGTKYPVSNHNMCGIFGCKPSSAHLNQFLRTLRETAIGCPTSGPGGAPRAPQVPHIPLIGHEQEAPRLPRQRHDGRRLREECGRHVQLAAAHARVAQRAPLAHRRPARPDTTQHVGTTAARRAAFAQQAALACRWFMRHD